MGKISNDIRNWCAHHECTPVDSDDCDELRAIADRIDHEMVELPKDRDGVPIHTGDKVWDVRDGQKLSVIGIVMEAYIVRIYVTPDDTVEWYAKPTDFTHKRPDSWESIAGELDEMVEAAQHADDNCEKLADIAERIRKLAEKEGE